jgi:hypothetical protein
MNDTDFPRYDGVDAFIAVVVLMGLISGFSLADPERKAGIERPPFESSQAASPECGNCVE